MNLLDAILSIIFTFGHFVLGAAIFIVFMGMQNNTKDENTFRLLNPFIIFMPDEFTEKGNKYRKNLIFLYFIAAIYVAVFFIADKGI